MSKVELKKRLDEIKIIYKKPVKMKSGEISDCYCDIKKSYGYPDILNLIADEIIGLLPSETTCIAGSGYGGIPLAIAVSLKSSRKLTVIRDKVKTYGMESNIEGYVSTEKDKVIIVDDVLDSGASILNTLSVLEKTKSEIIGVIVVVQIGSIKLPVPISCVFKFEEFFS